MTSFSEPPTPPRSTTTASIAASSSRIHGFNVGNNKKYIATKDHRGSVSTSSTPTSSTSPPRSCSKLHLHITWWPVGYQSDSCRDVVFYGIHPGIFLEIFLEGGLVTACDLASSKKARNARRGRSLPSRLSECQPTFLPMVPLTLHCSSVESIRYS